MMLEISDHGTVILTALLAAVFYKLASLVFSSRKIAVQREPRRMKTIATPAASIPHTASAPAIVETAGSRAAERSQRKLHGAAKSSQPQRRRPSKLQEPKRNTAASNADGLASSSEAKLSEGSEAPPSPAPAKPTFTTTYDDVAVHAMAAAAEAAAAAAESAARAAERNAGTELTPSMARRQRRKRMKQRAAAEQPAPAEEEEAPPVLPLVPPAELRLDLPPEVLYQLARQYMLPAQQLHMLGFPHSSSFHRGKAYIYKSMSGSPRPTRKVKLDAAAKEFVPRALASSSDCDSGTHSSETGDDSSGSGSGSEPPDEQQVPDDVSEPESVHSSGSSEAERPQPVLRPLCVRCSRPFAVTPDGVYTDATEKCVFHWGKLKNATHGAPTFACCGGRPSARGCSTASCHVWSGLLPGLNGPLKGYVRTRKRRSAPSDGSYGVYALDCEMCYTGQGLELARVSVVGVNGKKVYDAFVQPERPVVDYNTRFSGITARQLDGATKTLRAVQSDLMGFISADTVLIGHGLENDLRALRLVHDTVVDTSVLFPHYLGLPYRRRLSQLTSSCLGWSIQQDSGAAGRGHDSLEDARACMQLLLWRTRRDLRLD